MLLDNLALFLLIVEKGGLAAAGREMGLAPATVSARLAALEQHYGAALLTRTTRAISLTEEGRLLVEGARRLLAEADEIESRIRLGIDKIAGPIRLTAPLDLGRRRVEPIVAGFMADHPDVAIDLILTDAQLDLVAQGIDLALRFGSLENSSLRARTLGPNRRIVCAAPSYLKARGTPGHPDDLAQHDCLLMRFGQDVAREWPFAIDGRHTRVAVHGRHIASDGGLVREWCLRGYGIALKSVWDVEADLASGALVELLEDYSVPGSALQIVYPPSAIQPRRIRALIERIAAELTAPAAV